ncbi:MAG: DUF3127 domain-containing protein [Bacteroidales bacterium]|nr:DUF3127 domain-containing protein [Bacteroidales bacterium]
MEITGRLILILPTQSGESQRGPWVRGGFVIETTDTFPRKVCFNMFGEDRLAMLNGLAMNSMVTVTFSPESREFNDRWYTDLRCISVYPAQGAPAAAPMAGAPAPAAAPAAPAPNFAQAPTSTMPGDSNDDLPF